MGSVNDKYGMNDILFGTITYFQAKGHRIVARKNMTIKFHIAALVTFFIGFLCLLFLFKRMLYLCHASDAHGILGNWTTFTLNGVNAE